MVVDLEPLAAARAPRSFGRTPAVHTIVAVAISVPSCSTTPASSADATSVFVRTSTPRRSSSRRAYSERRGTNIGSRRSPPSSNRMRSADGGSSGYSRGSTSRASSPSAPAYSTPVGPPPTMQNVSSRVPFRRRSARSSRVRGTRARGCGAAAPRRDPSARARGRGRSRCRSSWSRCRSRGRGSRTRARRRRRGGRASPSKSTPATSPSR